MDYWVQIENFCCTLKYHGCLKERYIFILVASWTSHFLNGTFFLLERAIDIQIMAIQTWTFGTYLLENKRSEPFIPGKWSEVKWKFLSHVWLFVTPWTVAHQAPLSMEILQARIVEWVAISFSSFLGKPLKILFANGNNKMWNFKWKLEFGEPWQFPVISEILF